MRTALTSVALVLVVLTLGIACSSSTPTPAPTTAAPTTAAPTTAAPTTAAPAATTQAPATPHPNVAMPWLIATRPFAPLISGVRAMVESGSTWLTLQPQDATAEQGWELVGADANLYKGALFWGNEEATIWNPQGTWPREEAPVVNPPPAVMFAVYAATCQSFQTLDPNIKTLGDMIGKRVWPGAVGTSSLRKTEALLRANDLYDKVRVLAPGAPGQRNEPLLADDKTDVGFGGWLTSASMAPPTLQLIQSGKRVYWVDITPEQIEKARQFTGEDIYFPLKLRLDVVKRVNNVDYDPLPKDEVHCLGGISVVSYVHPQLDDDVAYELMRSILEHRDLMAEHFPGYAPVWKERLGHVFLSQERFHPMARRAYEEFGVTYGLEGMRAFCGGSLC